MIHRYTLPLLVLPLLAATPGTAPAPQQLDLILSEVQIVCAVERAEVTVRADGLVLAGDRWQLRPVDRNQIDLVPPAFARRYLRVHPLAGKVWLVEGGRPGRVGGKLTLTALTATQTVKGEGDEAYREVRVGLKDLHLGIDPTGEGCLLWRQRRLDQGLSFEVAELRRQQFQVRRPGWNQHWDLDVPRKRATLIDGGPFGGLGGMMYPSTVRIAP